MNEKTKILAFCLTKIPSAIVCIIQPLMELENRGVLKFEFLKSNEVNNSHIMNSDVVICIRGSEQVDLDIIQQSKNLGKYTIYLMDDDLLNIPTSSICREYYHNKNTKKRIKLIMKESNCLWTTNKNIASKYEYLFDKVAIINVPALLLNDKINNRNLNRNKKQIVIGFAGGLDHRRFFEKLLMKPITFILNKYRNKVKVEIFGFELDLMNELRIHNITYKPTYEQYYKTMYTRKWDIGLAPLQNTKFHSCKYFNKFLEYGAIKTVGIYSDTEPYTFVINNKENGILVKNTTCQWIKGLEYLINSKRARQEISDNAYKLIKKDFTIASISNEILEKIPEITNYKS